MPWRILGASGEVREYRPVARLRYDDFQAIADAAVAGCGLAWLPCWLMAPYVRDGKLALVMGSERMAGAEASAVRPNSRHTPSKVRAAIDALVDEIPRLMGSV